MSKALTISQWVDHYMSKYLSKEDFKIDLNRMILDLESDKTNPKQLAFYKRVRTKLNKRYFENIK